jgi:hypothetical protein
MTKRFVAEALKEFFVDGEWNMCHKCKKALLRPYLPENTCKLCNVSFIESELQWKQFAVKEIKKEADAVAEIESKAAIVNDKWPKNATTVSVTRPVFDAFKEIWDDKDSLSDWDEDQYGSIQDAMIAFHDAYKKLPTDKTSSDKVNALAYIRNGKTADEKYEGLENIMTIFATWKTGDAIPAP